MQTATIGIEATHHQGATWTNQTQFCNTNRSCYKQLLVVAIIAGDIKAIYHTADIEKYILYELYLSVNTVLFNTI